MTLLACIAIVFFGFAVYNLSCAIVDVPTKKTSRMMMLSRKQQGIKAEICWTSMLLKLPA